jgi:adenosylmethionine-8-amino-7-oxononanoate aminotransferase
MHGYTYTGHPLGCAAALACLDIVEDENLPARAAHAGARLLEGLKPLEESAAAVGNVRGKGLMIAIDLVADKKTREPVNPEEGLAYRLADAARERGAIVRPVGTKLILSPPLVISDEEVDVIVAALRGAFGGMQ